MTQAIHGTLILVETIVQGYYTNMSFKLPHGHAGTRKLIKSKHVQNFNEKGLHQISYTNPVL